MWKKLKKRIKQFNTFEGLSFIGLGAFLSFTVLTPALTLYTSIGLMGYGVWLVFKDAK